MFASVLHVAKRLLIDLKGMRFNYPSENLRAQHRSGQSPRVWICASDQKATSTIPFSTAQPLQPLDRWLDRSMGTHCWALDRFCLERILSARLGSAGAEVEAITQMTSLMELASPSSWKESPSARSGIQLQQAFSCPLSTLRNHVRF